MKKLQNRLFKIFLLVIVVSGLSACVTNPVTGKRQLNFAGEAWERKVGEQAYGPYIQQQGGEYLADETVQRYVRNVLSKLAAVSDRALPYEIVVLNNSVPNAWALPSGKMAINRGLLVELGSEAELAAVLGHEIVHAAASHGAQSQTRGTLLQGALILGSIAANGNDLLMQGAGVGAQLVNQKYGRGAELESDKYGMLYMSRAGYDPKAAITLQETFVRLSEGQQSDWLSGLFASHPPSQARVAANIEHAKALPAGGYLGVDEYKRVMSRLKNTQPAYEAFDKAKKAVSEGNQQQAKSLLAEAKRIEPNEGLFDILDGDIDYLNGNYQSSVSKYNNAIRKNPRYFEGYLSRGAAYYESGQFDKSYNDLKKSDSMLPEFFLNYYYLGLVQEKRGNIQESIQYLVPVAKSKIKGYSEKSQSELQRMSRQYPQYFR